jgi:hypothetical protein
MSTKNDNARNAVLIASLATLVLGTAYWLKRKPDVTDAAGSETAAEVVKAPALAVGQLFKANDTFYCNTNALLHDTIALAKARDRAKFAANFRSQSCGHIDPLATYKVIGLEGDAVQFVNVAGDSNNAQWMLHDAVKELAK